MKIYFVKCHILFIKLTIWVANPEKIRQSELLVRWFAFYCHSQRLFCRARYKYRPF